VKREAHPMQAKKYLARRIVADFHSADVATKAGDDWAKQFQKDQLPEAVEEVKVNLNEVSSFTGSTREPPASGLGCPVKLDKLLTRAGFASSRTEAARQIKANSVRVEGELKTNFEIHLDMLPVMGRCTVTIRVGRQVKRVIISS
jgi:tyrosyl-tRNA synthetase